MLAAVIFVFTYVAFSVGRVPGFRSDRVAAAVIGAVLLVAIGVLSVDEAQRAVNGRTLGLLFGMMLLSAALDVSGAFALVGWWVTRRARSPLALLAAVSIASAVLSAFLINDVVCIAFTPLVLRIAEALNRSPKPYLLALATSSNIGSVATVTGNPQNILIASLSHISYGRFAIMLAPVAVVALRGKRRHHLAALPRGSRRAFLVPTAREEAARLRSVGAPRALSSWSASSSPSSLECRRS